MPITPTYPGVYIEEVPSGVRAITGVSTSVAAFIGYVKKGPMNKAVQIFNMGDFEREFGGLDAKSEVCYAVQQFFLNGGQEAWVVRTAAGSYAKADVQIQGGIGGSTVLTVQAISEGEWGNHMQVSIDHNTATPASLFNMTVSQYALSGVKVQLAQSEVFRNLSMSSSNARFVETVVNDETSGSKLVRVTSGGAGLPLQNGTVSGSLSPFPTLTKLSPAVNVTIGTEGTYEAKFSAAPTTLTKARSVLEAAIRSAKPDNPAFASAKVEIFQNSLRILAGPTRAVSRVTFGAGGSDPTVTELKLDSSSSSAAEVAISNNLAGFTGLAVDPTKGAVDVTISGVGTHTATFSMNPTSVATARTQLEKAIRAADTAKAFTDARVAVHSEAGEERLVVVPGVSGASVSFAATAGDTTTVTDLGLDSVTSAEALISGDLSTFSTLTTTTNGAVDVAIGMDGPHTANFTTKPGDLTAARDELEPAIRGAQTVPTAAFTAARVAAYTFGGDGRLIVVPGDAGVTVLFSAAPLDTDTVSELKLDTAGGVVANVQEYTLGAGAAIPNTAQGAGTVGNNGTLPDGTALIGNLAQKKGMYALEDVDLFNILCIPRTAMVSGTDKISKVEAAAVLSAAKNYCIDKRAFLIVDTPSDVDEVDEIKDWLDDNATLRHKNSALYFPRVKIPDPLNEYRLRAVGASGTIAGLYARTDSAHGVWKAPAGTEATLANVQALDYTLTDMQNGTLNPLGINCLRNFSVYGNVCWGSRTLDGADQMASEWKYIPVRRMALFLEESLYRGLKWVVFEPNDEPLWSQIRLNVGSFMHRLFRQGAFQGITAREAYLVKCDKETTTQADIDLGVVNIVVGFAPLKPAEFVFIKIKQLAGQIQA